MITNVPHEQGFWLKNGHLDLKKNAQEMKEYFETDQLPKLKNWIQS